MKYILVTGGVISGVGKGVIASSFGTILKCCGIHVTSIKIDPYINIDAGTFSPYEHGEVYVLDDGGEVDLDLGNYERFLDITLHKHNNITTGKIYQHVISKERRGDYLGKTVQVVPHITDAIQEWVERVAMQSVTEDGDIPEVCIVELGGTIGDIEGMPFVEAFRQFQFRVKRENFCCVHVSLVPQLRRNFSWNWEGNRDGSPLEGMEVEGVPRATGEHKTKPTQASVRELRGLGLSPDLIVCRSEKPIDHTVKEKISNFCHVSAEQVICIHDCPSIYRVPILMEGQGISEFFNHRLQLNYGMPRPRRFMQKWIDLADRYDNLRKEVKIALVGKYTKLEDSYASVAKALQHAAIAADYKLNLKYIEASDLEKDTKLSDPVAYHEAWQQLCKCDGVIVPGGFGKRGSEGKIEACDWCRKTMKPMLGICLGLQAAVIEFSRHVLGLENANSTEVDPETPHPVVVDMPEHNQGQMGGTMRLGRRKTVFQQNHNSVLRSLYGKVESIQERHRHRYEVNPAYVEKLEAAGMKFVGRDVKGERMEMMELAGHPYFVATQFHPEYLSRPLSPSPPYLGLILASIGKLTSYISRGCRLSPRQHHSDEDFSGVKKNEETLVAAANEKLKIVVQEKVVNGTI